MILSLATVHENDAVIPLRAKEEPGWLIVGPPPLPSPSSEEGSHFHGSEESSIGFRPERDSLLCPA